MKMTMISWLGVVRAGVSWEASLRFLDIGDSGFPFFFHVN
jgi:hypothetical protein